MTDTPDKTKKPEGTLEEKMDFVDWMLAEIDRQIAAGEPLADIGERTILDCTPRPNKGKREMTDEEMGKITIEEAVTAVLELGVKAAEAQGAYEAARLRLKQILADPDLTEEQRKTLRDALAVCG